jgi:hypothetical protein
MRITLLTFILIFLYNNVQAQVWGYQGHRFTAYGAVDYSLAFDFDNLFWDDATDYSYFTTIQEKAAYKSLGLSFIIGRYTEIEGSIKFRKIPYGIYSLGYYKDLPLIEFNPPLQCKISVVKPSIRIKYFTRNIPAPLGLYLGVDLALLRAAYSYDTDYYDEKTNNTNGKYDLDTDYKSTYFKPSFFIGYQRIFFDRVMIGIEGDAGLPIISTNNPETLLAGTSRRIIRRSEVVSFRFKAGIIF